MDTTQIVYSLVLEFIRRAMRCFTCCFRVRDDHPAQSSRFSQPVTAVRKEDVDSRDRCCVWPLLAREDEDEDLSQCEEGWYDVTDSACLDEELRAEAKFLKACGTLPQTPAEIRKTKKSKDTQPQNEETESPFISHLPNTSIEDTLQKQPDHSPITVFQKWNNGSDSSFHSSNSTSVENYAIGPAVSTHCKNKSVHFESQSDSSKNSSPSIINPPMKLNESPFTISKPSPYPTPLKLTDDMQTPGTVFPSYGKNQRIRVQYLNSGINPRNFCQSDTPIEEECVEESPQSELKLQQSTNRKELNLCPTLSSWLPPKSTNDEDCIDQSLPGQTPGDRVILGVLNSDWNADETPKWGDVNGIPNTTNKYSEDQKVKWHATPFEERLEKALLEEKFIPKMLTGSNLERHRVSNFDDKEEHENAGF